ncbi:unnamed protein product [[Candida] boidinii]|nr:unnamed protein product [[Candida] boidinii]
MILLDSQNDLREYDQLVRGGPWIDTNHNNNNNSNSNPNNNQLSNSSGGLHLTNSTTANSSTPINQNFPSIGINSTANDSTEPPSATNTSTISNSNVTPMPLSTSPENAWATTTFFNDTRFK